MSASWVRRTFLFPLRDQFRFLRHFTELVTAEDGEESLTPKEGLTILRRIYSEQAGADANEVKISDELLNSLKAGLDIHEAMEDWFHPDICLTYRASLESGGGVAAVNSIIDVMRDQNQLKRDFALTMFVPIMLLIVGLVMFAIVSISIIPMFFGAGADMEKAGVFIKAVIAGGNVLSKIWLPLLVFTPIIIGMFVYFMPRMGLTAVYRNFAAGRFFSLFALLLDSHVSMREALQLLFPHVSPFLQDHLDEMLLKTQSGESEFLQLDTGLLPLELRVRMHVSGQRGGGSSTEIFNVLSKNATKDFGRAILKTSNMAKWTMMLVGLGLLFLSFGSIFMMASDILMSA